MSVPGGLGGVVPLPRRQAGAGVVAPSDLSPAVPFFGALVPGHLLRRDGHSAVAVDGDNAGDDPVLENQVGERLALLLGGHLGDAALRVPAVAVLALDLDVGVEVGGGVVVHVLIIGIGHAEEQNQNPRTDMRKPPRPGVLRFDTLMKNVICQSGGGGFGT